LLEYECDIPRPRRIPWYVAPMKNGHDGKRTIGVQLDRVVGATGQRMGWPAIYGEESRFKAQAENGITNVGFFLPLKLAAAM